MDDAVSKAADALTHERLQGWQAALFPTGHAHQDKELSRRQRKMLNVLLDAGPDGFERGMSTKKYESLTGASRAT